MKNYRSFFCTMICLPISIILISFCMNYLVDPYNMNMKYDFGLDKKIISYKGNYRLYKLQAFVNAPCENIYLGDSRMDGLNNNRIVSITGEKWFNFAYGAGTAYEIVDSFWFAAERVKMQKVVIGINFNLYNMYNRMNLVNEAKNTLSSQSKYYLSGFVSKMSVYNLVYLLSDKKINMVSERPEMDKEQFWQKQLNKTTECFYGRYQYPKDLYDELCKIVEYCQAENIELVFIVPPTHVDLQRRIEDFGLKEEYERFLHDLRSFGVPVYDFDVPGELTMDKALYKDPYHADEEVKEKVVDRVWGKFYNKNTKVR